MLLHLLVGPKVKTDLPCDLILSSSRVRPMPIVCTGKLEEFEPLYPSLQCGPAHDEDNDVETKPSRKTQRHDFFQWPRPRPPVDVDDPDLLLYDVFLLVNLSLSISFWVVHRMKLDFIGQAFNEGCLLALCWVVAGLWNGVFLYSAVDGHYGSADERAGPKAAFLLAFHTFIGSINIRLVVALLLAVVEHRPIGGFGGEELLPLELGCGLILMSGWRALHSSMTPRL